MRLQTTFMLTAGLLGTVGISAALALVVTTTLLAQDARLLSGAVESVRVAKELQINLLLHSREHRLARSSGDPRDRAALDQSRAAIVSALESLARFVGGPEEGVLVAQTREDVERWLRLAGVPQADPVGAAWTQRMDEALRSTRALAVLNVAQARGTVARDERLSGRAKLVGYLSATLLLVGILGALWLATFWIYRPLADVRRMIGSFATRSGHRPAELQGPREIRDLAVEFNDMAAALQRHEQRQFEFLAGVAHDLRNPLNALRLVATRLGSGAPLPPEEKVRELLGRMGRQVDLLARMVDDLLERTRIEAGDLELRLEDCDLVALASEAVELARGTLESHALQTRLPGAPVRVRCDPTRMAQVLSNLLSNAVKYSPGGGRITVTLGAAEGRALLAVSDEGLGIGPAELQRIFEPFARTDATRTTIPGVGLGLAVSRRIVAAHGGELDVHSQKGVGSTFTVRLPLLTRSPEHEDPPPARPAP